ncbi:hypothetical protein I5E68_09880 [Novosphingobium sp. YJ-S2-02]|uniref:Uncharacterized protein n=1 Tax=Novosphingobium aureum TaxID=2792964 RepID=A0A931HCG5_9SPHN|nr:hypothetical protein [Novosphingobium aureum]MBH0113254.1 hypothetical protein [Novosphingobium aureum]
MIPFPSSLLYSAAEGAVAANMIVYPLTYDEEDSDGANTLTRYGPGSAISPDGFQGDGYTTRLTRSSLPSWATSSSGPVSLSVHCRLWRRTAATSDLIAGLVEDDVSADAKISVVALTDGDEPCFGSITNTGSVRTRYLGNAFWKYALPWPTAFLYSGANKVRPQSHLFLDATTLLVSGHYNDTESRVYKIDLTDNSVIGTFTFGTSTYRHVAAWAVRANGDVWCTDFETDMLLKIDLDASFSSGNAVIDGTWDTSGLDTGLSALDFITVSGIEYALINAYNNSARYTYVFDADDLGVGVALPADRYKRFYLGNRNQGFCVRASDGLLYMSRSGTVRSISVFDIASAISSTADGSTLPTLRSFAVPSALCEDIKFHPSTDEAWVSTEGRSSVADNDGYSAYWRSPLISHEPVERHIRIDYDGSGGWEFWLDGILFDTDTATPTAVPAQLAVGGYPQATAGWANGFSMATIRSVAFKDGVFSEAELTALEAGTYEANSLTEYNVTISNPGAESGTASWTNESGVIGTRSADPAPHFERGVTNTSYFFGGTSAATVARQRFSIAAATGLSPSEIDTLIASGDIWANLRWWQSNYNGTADPGGCGIRYLDGVPAALSTTYSAIDDLGQALYWMKRSLSVAPDSGSRNIDLLQRMDRTAGTNNDTYIDDLELTIYTR